MVHTLCYSLMLTLGRKVCGFFRRFGFFLFSGLVFFFNLLHSYLLSHPVGEEILEYTFHTVSQR